MNSECPVNTKWDSATSTCIALKGSGEVCSVTTDWKQGFYCYSNGVTFNWVAYGSIENGKYADANAKKWKSGYMAFKICAP